MAKTRSSKSMTREELAGEIFDLNKAQGYKNPFRRDKAIKIMLSSDGYTKSELAELRDDLLKKAQGQKDEWKATKSSSSALSPKVAKADELRRVAINAGKKVTKTLNSGKEKIAKVTTESEKTAVRKQYVEKHRVAKLEADKAFNDYDKYLQETFGIDNAYIATNEAYVSTEKGFINWLQAKFSKRKKK